MMNTNDSSACPMIIEESGHCQSFIFVLYTVIVGPLCVIGIVGNSLILWILYHHIKTLKSSSRVLLQALAATDLILLLTMLPTFCLEPLLEYTDWLKNYTKLIYPYLYVYIYPVCSIAHTSSVWVTVLVGISRYVAICKPFKFPSMFSETKTKLYVAIVVFLALGYNFPLFFDCKISFVSSPSNNRTKQLEISALLVSNHLYIWLYESLLYFFFLYMVPLIILGILGGMVIQKLNGQYMQVKRAISRAEVMENVVTRMLLTVILIFVACQTPAMINRMLQFFLTSALWECGNGPYYFGHICNLLLVAEGSVNILLYALLNKNFKSSLHFLFCQRTN